jgi:hypothetical protein
VADKKVIFVAFPIEDEDMRDLLRGQSLNTRTPFEYIDMSVREAYDYDWKDKVRTRIRRSHGVIALITKNSLTSSGQKWEVECAKTEGKSILAMWPKTTDRTAVSGVTAKPWSHATIADFIDSL